MDIIALQANPQMLRQPWQMSYGVDAANSNYSLVVTSLAAFPHKHGPILQEPQLIPNSHVLDHAFLSVLVFSISRCSNMFFMMSPLSILIVPPTCSGCQKYLPAGNMRQGLKKRSLAV